MTTTAAGKDDEHARDEAAPSAAEETKTEAAPPGAPAAPTKGEPQSVEPTFREILRDAYFIFDRRTLGFARLMLGFFTMADLCRRGMVWEDMFGPQGVMPNWVRMQRPDGNNWTVFHAFTSNAELWVLWTFMFMCGFFLFIGWKTKVWQVLLVFLITSCNGRQLLIENGGYTVNDLLYLWTAFLPLGDRFSVDAMQKSWRSRRESNEIDLNDRVDMVPPDKQKPHFTIMGLILVIQLAAIYGFNVVHKKGPAWHNGTAVHFVLYVDRMVTPFVAYTRDFIPNWMFQFMTRSTITFEAALPFALLLPVFVPWARRAAIFMINTLHLAFGTSMVLGPFAWSLCVFSTLLFRKDDWELAYKTMRRTKRARTVLYNPSSGAAFMLCRLLKRMDTFELLDFRAEEGLKEGIVALTPEGERRTRSRAMIDLISVIPLGPIVALVPRALPGLFDWILAKTEDGAASRWFGLKPPSSTFIAPPPSPARRGFRYGVIGFREALSLLMFAVAVDEAGVQLWAIRDRWKVPQPQIMSDLANKLRFQQGWYMFSPNPVMDDGTTIVDAITVDGRHVDPFTGKEPNFDLLHAKSFRYNQPWSDYLNRIHLPGNTGYRDAMKDYLLHYSDRTGNPKDKIVSFEVWWVQDMNPPWGSTQSYKFEKNKYFSYEPPKPVEAPKPIN